MKKLLVMTAAFLLTTIAAIAQPSLSKGDFLVSTRITGADLSIADGNVSFGLGARAGCFIANDFAIMGGLGMDFAKDYSRFSIDLGARYYIAHKDNGSFFAGALLGMEKQKDIDSAFALTLEGGYSIFIHDHVALDPMLSLWIPFSKGYDVRCTLGLGFTIFF